MTTGLSIDDAAWSEFGKRLRSLPDKVSKKIVRSSLRKAAAPVLREAIELAPEGETGLLKKSIKLHSQRSRRGRLSIQVGMEAGFYRGETFYAGFVEFGHRLGKRPSKSIAGTDKDKRGFVPAVPFLRPALDRTKDVVLNILRDEVGEGIVAAIGDGSSGSATIAVGGAGGE